MSGADVRVVGVGGAGGNALVSIIENGIEGASLIAANTDAQALEAHPANERIVLGARTTRGLGAGGRPSVGFAAAQESANDIAAAVEGADMVFVATGLGGGTGTGAAPMVAHIAREQGALVVGVVTMPFGFEGGKRAAVAEQGLNALGEQVDSMIVIPNERLLDSIGGDPSIFEAFEAADQVLTDGVRGIGDLVLRPGLVNLDFADVRAVLMDAGYASMGMGVGRGQHRAVQAVTAATQSPLCSRESIMGASGLLVCFTIDPTLGLGQIHKATAMLQAQVDEEAEILFGVCVDPNLDQEVRVTVVAAGLEQEQRVEEEEVVVANRAQRARSGQAMISSQSVVDQDRPFAPVAAMKRRNALVMLS